MTCAFFRERLPDGTIVTGFQCSRGRDPRELRVYRCSTCERKDELPKRRREDGKYVCASCRERLAEAATRLPPGETCATCDHWLRCRWLISTMTGDETACDWSPSRFQKAKAPGGQP